MSVAFLDVVWFILVNHLSLMCMCIMWLNSKFNKIGAVELVF